MFATFVGNQGLTKLASMARAVGINHVALEVGDLEEALAFWQRLFGPLELRGRSAGMAFVDLGDQFVALQQGRSQPPDRGRHFGVVVDDKEAVRARAREERLPVGPSGGRLRFPDPWGNNIEVVDYRDVQFTKAPHVARAMGLDAQKSERALAELREKGLAPPED
jgi:catechol 2,3-dioxygenase-like lactoylglutathione lyase family enzyme